MREFSGLPYTGLERLWRRGAGTPEDPDNGRPIYRLTGIDAWLYARRCDNRAATWRCLYWWIIRRYPAELCQHCGRPVRVAYMAPDWIWEAVTGRARHQDGHAAPGILCPPCLTVLAREKGLRLRWTCAADGFRMLGMEGGDPEFDRRGAGSTIEAAVPVVRMETHGGLSGAGCSDPAPNLPDWLRAVWFALGELPACFRASYWAARR